MLLSIIKGTGKYAKLAMKCDECGAEYVGRNHTVEKQGNFHRCNSCTRRNNINTARLQLDFAKKISEAKKGKPFTEKHKLAMKGRIVSKETRVKISESRKQQRKSVVKYRLCLFECDKCGCVCKLKTKTIFKLYNLYKNIYCKNCYQSITGKKTAAKMSAVYSKLYSGDGNFAKKPGVGKKISEALKGIPFTDARKKTLCVPKSKTDKIKEAANRPEERERRSRLMCERLINGNHNFASRNHIITTNKSNGAIRCRSRLEVVFLEKLDFCKRVISVESAEYLKLKYYHEGIFKTYLPDFKVTLISGEVIIIEVKSVFYMKKRNTGDKLKALKKYTEENSIKWGLVTERTMKIWLERLGYGKQ